MKHVYDKNGAFKYTPAVGTNIRLTFERVRREQEQARAATQQKVSTIKLSVKGRAPQC